MALNVDEAANFVCVQLIEQEPCIYDRRHPDYARQDKIDLEYIYYKQNLLQNQNHYHIMEGSILLSDITEKLFTKLAGKHTHLI
jgi:hypothetical protein